MKKKKIVNLIVVLSTLIILLSGTTVAFATGVLSLENFGYTIQQNKASLDVVSQFYRSKPGNLDPKLLITKVTDYDGNSIDSSNVEISSLSMSKSIQNQNWVDVPLDEILNDDGTIPRGTSELGSNFKITFRYTYQLPAANELIPVHLDEVIEKTAIIKGGGF